MKIGDKVKFDEYLKRNYITGLLLNRTLSGKILGGRKIFTSKRNDVIKYMEPIIKEETLYDGVYIGMHKKKLIRSYRVTPPVLINVRDMPIRDNLIVETDRIGRIVREVERPDDWTIMVNKPPYTRDRYSENNPRRLDNPRELDTIALIKVNKKILGVPMSNINKHNNGYKFKVL